VRTGQQEEGYDPRWWHAVDDREKFDLLSTEVELCLRELSGYNRSIVRGAARPVS